MLFPYTALCPASSFSGLVLPASRGTRMSRASLSQRGLGRKPAAPGAGRQRCRGGGEAGEIGTVGGGEVRSEEHTSELQSIMRMLYAVFCLKKTKNYLQSTR